MTYSEFLQFLDKTKSNETKETPDPVELTDEQKLFYYYEQEQQQRAYFENQQH
jgi:hypothetical protein